MLPTRRGQTLLMLVLVIGTLITAAGVALIAVVVSVTSSGYAYRASETVGDVSMGGMEDAMLQMVRNGGFSSGGYTVPVGAYNTTVTVSQNAPSGYITVLSTASAINVTRQWSATFTSSTVNGQINLIRL